MAAKIKKRTSLGSLPGERYPAHTVAEDILEADDICSP
jgi:hypothetical protein